MNDPPSPATGRSIVRWVLGSLRWRTLAGATAGIVWMGATASIPVALGLAVDRAVDPDTDASTATVVRWAALLFAVAGTVAVAGAIRHHLAVSLFVRTRWMLEQRVTARVLDHRGGELQDAGTLLAASQNDARAVGGIADLMCRGSGAVVTLIGVGAVMLATSPLLGIVVLIGLPLSMLSLVPLWRPYARRAATVQATMADASATATDVIGGLRSVRGLSVEATTQRWFHTSVTDVERAGVSASRVGAVWQAISLTVPSLFLALVLVVGGNLTIDGTIDAGELVTFSGLAVFLTVPLQTLAEVGDVWARGLAGAGRIATVLNTRPSVGGVAASDAALGTDPSARVELREVGAGPPGSVPPFELIADGRIVGVASGDTDVTQSLVDLLAGRRETEPGTYLVDGIDARAVPPTELRRRVLVDDGRLPWLLDGTLLDNLAIGARVDSASLDLATATAALGTAGLDEFTDRPDHEVGEGGRRLSGGQRQRAALARAVIAAAPALVLVEPTNALDSATEVLVAERLAASRRGRTTIIVTSSDTLLAACDVVVGVDRPSGAAAR